MRILKYTYQGKDVIHDIHYEHQGKFCRYGSDEEASQRLIKAYRDVNEHCSELARTTVRVKRMTVSGSLTEQTITFEVFAAANNGNDMKIVLPKVGWRKGSKEAPGGTWEEVTIPKGGIDLDFVNAIQELIGALKEYVQTGAGQLTFGFESPQEAFR